MPFCDQCGAENPTGVRFCDQCGAPMIFTSPIDPATAPPPSREPIPMPVEATSAGPHTCPQCGAAVIPGQAFCDECGFPLLANATPVPVPQEEATPAVPPQQHYPAPQPFSLPPNPAAAAGQPAYTPPPASSPGKGASLPREALSHVRLIIPHRGVSLTLPSASQAMVGRADPVSKVYPDIDLTPYGGLEQGVGRRHLRMYINQGQVYVDDLQSTNGSFLNGNKLLPGKPRTVQDGDELRLGNMVLRIQI
ncbi:MAG: FHA domain-containing protein [Chloroflexaceae bacterium]|nr:FHA domain-containing protein [Chloroflexaceae bacterium]NJO07260.1 FHA domain-containing protein [Chloroflexaceae bacterium]